MADGTVGLGDVGNTRPSRAERRQQAARIAPEPVEPAPAPEPSAPTPVPAPTPQPPQSPLQAQQPTPTPTEPSGLDNRFEARRGKSKVQFTTRISSETDARIAWMARKYGISTTSIAEAALQDILDKSGVPEPDFFGNMPD